ncbi:hypothetical protein [Kineococcus terrestris]|uniref:hypothetical protein n=1 Tax=Kineococcus terrestris TaxID=2044856 RepID=UPI0034DAC3EF
MSRALDAATFSGLEALTGLGMPPERAAAALAAYNGVLGTLAGLDGVPFGDTPPAAAFNASWE